MAKAKLSAFAIRDLTEDIVEPDSDADRHFIRQQFYLFDQLMRNFALNVV